MIAPTVGPYSVTVGAVINRPGSRRVPSTGRWIRTGTWRAIGDRPYGGAWDEFRITAAHPKNVRHSERNEVESKNLLRSEKEERRGSFGTRLSPLLRMTRVLGCLRWLVGVRSRNVAGDR